jgi:hypothetical protein
MIDSIARKNDVTITAVIKSLLVYSLYHYKRNTIVREIIDEMTKNVNSKKRIPFRLRVRIK